MINQCVASESQTDHRVNDGWIYFIADDAAGLMKIGRARDVSRRLSSLQTGASNKLRLEYAIRADPSSERWFHYRFKHLRVRGEWFAFDDAMFDAGDDDFDFRGIHDIADETPLTACQAAYLALTMGRPWHGEYAAALLQFVERGDLSGRRSDPMKRLLKTPSRPLPLVRLACEVGRS